MESGDAVVSECLLTEMERAGPGVERSTVAWPQSIREFEALIELVQHRLVQFAFCRLHCREDAEDVVQDVLVQAYRDRERHRRVTNATPFLFRIVANRCSDLLRRRRYDGGSVEDLDTEPAGADGGSVEQVESLRRLRWIEGRLRQLPSEQSDVIRLRVHGELPFETIAEVVGCSVPTVKSRFRYGVERLRRILEQEGVER